MLTVGLVLGKSQHKDSADDVAAWKGLLTSRELQQRKSFLKQGKEPPRFPSDQILLRYLRKTVRQNNLPICVQPIDSHKIKDFPLSQILEIFDRFDIILLLTTTFLYESRKRSSYEDFYALLNKTQASVYPNQDYLRFIFDKSAYLKHLKSHRIPIIPTGFWFSSNPEKEASQSWRGAQSWLKARASQWKSPRLVLKGSHSAGQALYLEWDTTQSKDWPSVAEWLSFVCRELQMPSVLVQPYLKTFAEGQEIRTYWINEEFAYALIMGSPPRMHPQELTMPDGRIHPHLESLLPLGKTILSLLPKDELQPKILTRLDFVKIPSLTPHTQRSHRNSKKLRTASSPSSVSFLLNEIETLEACLLADWTSYDIIETLGNELLLRCKIPHS